MISKLPIIPTNDDLKIINNGRGPRARIQRRTKKKQTILPPELNDIFSFRSYLIIFTAQFELNMIVFIFTATFLKCVKREKWP